MKKPKRSGRNVNAKRGTKRSNRNAKRDRLAATIQKMAANGLVEDQIALRLGLDKNDLRKKFIDHIKRGKRLARAREARAGDMTREEMHAADAILTPGSFSIGDLWRGLNGEARDAPDAFAAWIAAGSKFITTGLDADFSPERLREFAALKAAAQELLKRR